MHNIWHQFLRRRKKMKLGLSSITIPVPIVMMVMFLYANTAIGGIVTDGLVSYWTFDERDIAGGTVKDKKGANDGEIIGAPEVVEGKLGNGLRLNGTTDYVKVSSLDVSPGTYPTITLMAWVYPTSDGTGGQASRRFLFGHDDGGWDRAILMQSSNWRTGTGNDGTDYWDTGVTVDLNTWQHVAVVYKEDDIEFYKDGKMFSYGSPGDVGNGNPFLLIGTHPTQARFFQGIVDEALVYDRALSKAEIKQNIDASGIAVENAHKLAARWGDVKVGN
jgi:hypothetical protein